MMQLLCIWIQIIFLIDCNLLPNAFLNPYNRHQKGIIRQFLGRMSPFYNKQHPAQLLVYSRATPIETSFEQKIFDCLRRNDTAPITVEAYVTSKRSLGKKLVFCDFQIADTNDGDDDVDDFQALLRHEFYTGENYDGYKRCLLKGCKLRVVGTASPTNNPGNAVLLINSFALVGVPRQLQHLQIILKQCQEGSIPLGEVASACHMDVSELRKKLAVISECINNRDSTQTEAKALMKTLSKEIFHSLPKDPHYPETVDQVKLSKKGNIVLPQVPKEWRKAPDLAPSREVKEPGSIVQTLQIDCTLPSRVAVEGWVQNRRRFDGNVTQLALVDNVTMVQAKECSTKANRLTCVVHPDLLPREVASLYNNLLAADAKIWVSGQLVAADREEEGGKSPVLLWVQDIHLLQSSSRSVTIRHLLDLMAEEKIDLEEAANAMGMAYTDALVIQKDSDPIGRQWKANQLAVQLQKNTKKEVNPKLLQTMEKYRPLLQTTPVTMIAPKVQIAPITNKPVTKSSDGDYQQQVIPLSMPRSRWMSKKKPQLEWMGQQIQTVLKSHPDYGTRKLSILDIGGGKGALANYLGQAIENVQIHVVDIAEGAVKNGRQKALRLDTPVEFQVADASASTLDSVEADVVVALHACGHLSDVALSHAIHKDAGFVIVPCCFNSNPHLTIPKKGPVSEWLGVPKDDWAALKLIAEVQGDITLANEAIEILCAIRADAARRKVLETSPETKRSINVYKFPIEYSTRNTVLVGSCG